MGLMIWMTELREPVSGQMRACRGILLSDERVVTGGYRAWISLRAKGWRHARGRGR